MVIIALGEGLIGTTAAMAVVIGPEGPGWSVDAVLLLLAGVGLTFGMWWSYFVIPSGEILQRRRERSFGWGYGHLVIFGSVVAAEGSLAWSLLVLALVPWVTVVGYELRGHRHNAAVLAVLDAP